MNQKIPTDIKNDAMKAIIDFAMEKVDPFTGPINKQDGTPLIFLTSMKGIQEHYF